MIFDHKNKQTYVNYLANYYHCFYHLNNSVFEFNVLSTEVEDESKFSLFASTSESILNSCWLSIDVN